MSTVEIWNLAASITSIVLAVVAILLSVLFFFNAKAAESSATNALEGIKGQTSALQELTRRWMDRLTRAVTTVRPQDEMLMQVVAAITNMPSTMSANLAPDRSHVDALTNSTVHGYIGAYYYAALANVVVQSHLPPLGRYNDNAELNNIIKRLVDSSCSDAHTFRNLLNSDRTRLENSPAFPWFQEAENNWLALLKDSTAVYASRQAEGV